MTARYEVGQRLLRRDGTVWEITGIVGQHLREPFYRVRCVALSAARPGALIGETHTYPGAYVHSDRWTVAP